MTRTSADARTRLDTRRQRLLPFVAEPRPHKGWIRAIRDALGMSGTELAARMGVTQPTLRGFEKSEIEDTIRIGTLRRAAEALDCDLVYFLVPRTTLDDAVKAQARRKAAGHLAQVAHHSVLEDQAVGDEDTAAQIDDLAARFIDRQGLWTQSDSAR